MLKSSRLWQNSPKLVKLAAGVLAAPLSKAINNSISKGVFPNEAKIARVSPPNEAKIARVSPLDKKTRNKSFVLNYRSISILLTFSKIFGKAIENYVMKCMDNYFSPHLSAYRASHNTQHMILCLIEE